MHILSFTSGDMDKRNIKLTDITLSSRFPDIFSTSGKRIGKVPNATLY